MYKSIFFNHWVYIFTLQTVFAMTLLNTKLGTVCANAVTPEIPTVSDNENGFMMLQDDKDEYGDLYSPWGKQSLRNEDFNEDIMPVMVFLTYPGMLDELANTESNDMNEDNIFNQKRGWKKMNVAWGKRRNAGQLVNKDFTSAVGSWGKREPNWNNLKGMWGKRSNNNGISQKRASAKSDQWNYLRGSWGKRSSQPSENN